MKRYLLLVALCFYWVAPIQASAAGPVCPKKGDMTPACEAYLMGKPPGEKPDPWARDKGERIVECIRGVQANAGKASCLKVLEDAQHSLPENYDRSGNRDTSPAKFIHRTIEKLPTSAE